MLELLLFALEDLRRLLKEQGSDLMIRFGRAENVIGELVQEVVKLHSVWFFIYDLNRAFKEENFKDLSALCSLLRAVTGPS